MTQEDIVRITIEAVALAALDFIQEQTVIKDSQGTVIEDAVIHLAEGEVKPLRFYVYERLAAKGITVTPEY